MRRLMRLEARDTRVQQNGRNLDARETSRVTRSAVNGRPADGISALPGSFANTVWYIELGHSLLHVAVPDWLAVALEIAAEIAVNAKRRHPQPRRRVNDVAKRIRRNSVALAPAGR
jgi:hypothetical protein